jgi:hypothetical protein
LLYLAKERLIFYLIECSQNVKLFHYNDNILKYYFRGILCQKKPFTTIKT